MPEESPSLRLPDGRSYVLAQKFAKAFRATVQRPHMTTDIRQEGYGPASFDIAIIDDDGTVSGRFAKVTVEIVRDVERAEHLRAEVKQKR